MAKGTSFNFGANASKKKTGTKQTKKTGKGKNGNRSNAWRQYVNSNVPILD